MRLKPVRLGIIDSNLSGSLKAWLVLALLVCGLGQHLWADYSSTVLSDSPSGYWRLGELNPGQAPAFGGSEMALNRGTAGAALNGYYFYDPVHPVAGALAGSSDTAVAFDGFKNRLDVPFAPVLNTPKFSVELWVLLTNSATRALTPISNRGTNANRGWVLYAYNGNTKWQFITYNASTPVVLLSTNDVALNTWTHLVGTFDGGTMRLFINGAEAAAPVSNPSYTPNPLVPLRLGGGNNHTTVGDFFWPGCVDEVAIYTNALSSDQILAHYQNGVNAARSTPYEALLAADNPVGYWRLNEPANSGTTSPQSVVNLGSAGLGANGVMFSVTNDLVPISFATNGIVGGIEGALSGDPNSALAFSGDAAQGRVDVPYQKTLSSNQFSVEAWARVPALYRDYQAIVACRDDAPTRGFVLYAVNTDSWEFFTGNGSGGSWQVLSNPGAGIAAGQWTHLVGVFDGTNKYFYVNGALVGFAANVAYAPNTSRPLRIGGGANETPTGGFFMRGGVDEVAVYPQVLSPERVLEHYRAARGVLPPATTPPTFTLNPANTTSHSLQTIRLTAGAVGSLPLRLQWYFVSSDGLTTNKISGATNNTLLIQSTSVANTGSYFVEAANSVGTNVSSSAWVEILPPQAPTLLADVPASVPVYVGGSTRIDVRADGTPPIGYQWCSNSIAIPGQTNASLLITNVQLALANTRYSVLLTNPVAQTTSSETTLNVLVAPASTYAATLTNLRPLSYWRLSETYGSTAFDYWGGNHGSYLSAYGGQMPGALADDDDGASAFFGVNSCLVVSNAAPFAFTGTNAFSLVTWARPDALGGVQRLFSNRSSGGFGIGFRNANQIRFTAFAVADVDASVPGFVNGVWYHIAAVRNGTSLQIYVDGVLKNSGTLANINASTSLLQLSGNPNNTGEFFTGAMDEPAIFNRALSASEIASLFAARSGALVPPTILQDLTPSVVYAGGTARFSVVASGSQPLSYFWKANGAPMPGASGPMLTLSNVTSALQGVNYSVTVSNRAGSVSSAQAPLTVLASYGYQAQVAADAPVAHWRLNETGGTFAFDQRGSYNGVISGAMTLGVPGAMAKDSDTAYNLDGSSAKVEVPYTPDLNPARFSIECWARVTGGSGTYRSPLSSRDYLAGYTLYANENNIWEFRTRAPSVGWQLQFGPAVVENEWTHLVGTFDGTNKNLYINGELVASEVNTNYEPNQFRPLRIGAGNNEDDPGAGGFYNFAGDIDEVAIYSYAISPERIAAHYQFGKYSHDTLPFMLQQPGSLTVEAGAAATLAAQAGGSPLLGYQWLKDGAPLPGATRPTLVLSNSAYSDNGLYSVLVTNALGSTNSLAARLTVMPPVTFCNLTNDLVLHLKFDGNYSDTSGRANHGAAVGAPTFTTGKIGSGALHYSTDASQGLYNYVTLGAPTDLQFGPGIDFSLACWIRWSGNASDLPCLASLANGSSWGYSLGPNLAGSWTWSLGDSNARTVSAAGAATLSDGQWHHLVLSLARSNNAATYLDGVLVDTRPLAALEDISNGQALNIGQDSTGYAASSGAADIDDVGIWRRALTAYEAQSIFAAGQTYARSFDSYGPVRLELRRQQDALELIWAAGSLEAAQQITGPWTTVSGAVAPYYKVAPSQTNRFFRVRL